MKFLSATVPFGLCLFVPFGDYVSGAWIDMLRIQQTFWLAPSTKRGRHLEALLQLPGPVLCKATQQQMQRRPSIQYNRALTHP